MTQQDHPSFSELVRVSARIGCLSFGGPVGQIALMHREIVEQRGWISEEQYLHALNFCHLLPGPEAQQLAIWIGWKLHGVKGGFAAGLLFVIPGALVILALSILYGLAAQLGWVMALFLGIKAAVLGIVVQALLRIAGRALTTRFKRVVALAAFVALAVFALPFPLVVLAAGLAGALAWKLRPAWLGLGAVSPEKAHGPRPWGASLAAIAIGGVAWGLPLALVYATLGPHHVLWQVGLFFSKLAVVTFGGAYAVLAYMGQQAVQGFGWLSAGEMADGLGLAETTPGPLIMVTQFVGYLAALRAPAPFTPIVAGLLGAALTTWVTFTPCFLWIFALAPWIERLEHAQRLRAALATITAAIVGVIANLSLWFALHVLFAQVRTVAIGPAQVMVPVAQSLDLKALGLAMLAALLLFRARWSVIRTLGATSLLGLALVALPG
ncbi:chromate efflux transporter [Novosphingobium sp.]|uniref:chromate efflux transporter n=1 Tax=Novosphingobium sp. TaxID=1874826 RepID=UPI0038BD89A5